MRPNLAVFSDHGSFVDGVAGFIAEAAGGAIAARGRFSMALSGGGTPKPIYTRLAAPDFRDRVDWKKAHFFFGDERCVPPDDARSNYLMAREAWFDRAPLPPENIHRIRGEGDPATEAQRYEREIARFHQADGFPVFDLILLGLGDDGHTASLFPGTAALREVARGVVAHYVEGLAAWRVTFTAPLINAARHVAFLVEGAGKARMLWNVLEGPPQPEVWPAQLICPENGALHWLTDAAAASKIKTSSE